MTSPTEWELYLVTDRAFSNGRSTLEIVEKAVKGGVSVVQLREKDLCTRDFYKEGLQIRDFLKRSGIPLIINDRIDIALALDADGVHLGKKDMPPARARRILGPDRIIGLSVECHADINKEAEACADYLALSPVFYTDTKTDISTPWGLEGITKARAVTAMPLIAIGSMKLSNADSVIEAGADCLAVVTAIVSAADPEEETRTLLQTVKIAKNRRIKAANK
jgi:thiamine-phosphate pyrophosphorylase